MALKDKWVNRRNGEDFVLAEDINSVAHAVIEIEDNLQNNGGASIELDTTLTQEGKAADAKAVGDELKKQSEAIADLQNKTPSDVSGLTVGQILALDGMFKIALFTKDPTAEYTAFKAAFGIEGGGEVEPDEPTETVSATFSNGELVISGVTVNSATFSDGVLAVA